MSRLGRARALASVCFLAVGPASGAAAEANELRAFIGGSELPEAAGLRIVVEQDLDQPDLALISLGGRPGRRFAQGVSLGADVRVEPWPGSAATSLFKGEVVGIEPVFDASGRRVIIRALNRLHRLAGEARTRTFVNVTDAEIVETLAAENGLLPATAPELRERYDLVYQHNQTDLEFLRQRAARLGYEVWCEDSTLFFREPDAPPPIVLARRRGRGTLRLETFHPRLSSSHTVQRVAVRGWNPEGREEIVGEAAVPAILVGLEQSDPGLVLGRTVVLAVDHPIFSIEEAQAIAKAKLEEFTMAYVTAEAESQGSSRLRPGRLVVLEGNSGQFDGKYYIRGTSHRYTHGCGGGYKTALKLHREDESLFFIPEIDDEVLVAFEHGDLRLPYVVGSLWDGDGDQGCSARQSAFRNQ